MSPGNKSARDRLQTEPPCFDPQKDSQEWHRYIRFWLYLILSDAELEKDRHFTTVANILGRALYERGFRSAQKSIIYEIQAKQQIGYR